MQKCASELHLECQKQQIIIDFNKRKEKKLTNNENRYMKSWIDGNGKKKCVRAEKKS